MNQAEIKRRQAQEVSNILALVIICMAGHLVGEKGITYTAVAAECCLLVWTAVCGELSDGLGRLLRARRNKGQYRNIVRMRGTALAVQATLGAAGSAALFFGADWIGEGIFNIPCSVLILKVLSPAVLLRSLTCAVTGYFQGEGAELPRAVAGIMRQLFILGFGLLFCKILGDYGQKVSGLLRQENYAAMYSGVGIALAVCLADFFILLFLVIIFKGSRRNERKLRQEGMYSADSRWDCVRFLCMGRWPQAVSSFMTVFPMVSGLLLFGWKAREGTAEITVYGLYAGKYLVVCGVLVCVISLLLLPVVGRIFLCFRRNENRFAKTVFMSGVHAGLVYGIFLTVYVGVMGGRIADILSKENGETVKQMLQGGACVILFAGLSLYFGRFLHTAGKRYPVLAALCLANVVYFAAAVLLSEAGILSLVYGGAAGMFVLCILLGVFSFRQMWVKADWLSLLIVPLGAGAAAGGVCALMGLAPLGDPVILPLAFAVSGAVYWGLLLALRNFKEQELEVIPGGRLIGALGQRLRFYS